MAQPQPSGLPASFPPRLWFHFHVPSIALSVPGCILLLPFSPPPVSRPSASVEGSKRSS
jgi:hypothetical protein